MSGPNYLLQLWITKALCARLSESNAPFMLVLSSIRSCYRIFPDLNSEDAGEEKPVVDVEHSNDEIQAAQR